MACPHCGLLNVDSALIIGLEILRGLGPEPIKVHDACRCPVHNLAVGGVVKSKHECTDSEPCKAADIEIKGLTMQQMYDRAEEVAVFRNGGIGVYDGKPFIHVDVRNGRARWGRVEGKYVAASQLVDTSTKEA